MASIVEDNLVVFHYFTISVYLKSGPIGEMASIVEDNLVVFHYLSKFVIWPDKKGNL